LINFNVLQEFWYWTIMQHSSNNVTRSPFDYIFWGIFFWI